MGNAYVGFEVFTAVVMKSSTFWDVTTCTPLKSTDASVEHFASIFRVEKYAKQEASKKQVVS
jgi:hypothetical protein